jgi:hypothetical protein
MRPAELADDHTPTIPVIATPSSGTSTGQTPKQVCCIYATAPFVRAEDLKHGLQVLDETGAPTPFPSPATPFPSSGPSASRRQGRVEMFHPEHFNTRSQDLEEAFHDAGQFYWGQASAWLAGKPIFSPDCRTRDPASPPRAGHRHARRLDPRRVVVQGHAGTGMNAAIHDCRLSGRRIARHRHRPRDALPDAGRSTARARRDCHFICREHPGHLLDHIRKRGFAVSGLPSCEQRTSAGRNRRTASPCALARLRLANRRPANRRDTRHPETGLAGGRSLRPG